MKIFCIGFNKTGTTSLALALMRLGYNVQKCVGVHDANINKILPKLIDKMAPCFDAFIDEPWNVAYKYFDANYEGKFILTTRDSDEWIYSLKKHCKNRKTSFRKWIYGHGNPRGHESEYIERFERHNEEVRQYFRGRELLEINITNGDGWEKLCPFLGREIPDIEFPYVNRSK